MASPVLQGAGFFFGLFFAMIRSGVKRDPDHKIK
jgi:hypothetical protein